MNLSQIRTQIQDEVDDTITTSTLDNWINTEMQAINGRQDWEYLISRGTATMSSGTNDYTISGDFSISDFGKALQLRDITNDQQYTFGNYENKDQLLADKGYTAVISPDNTTVSVYPEIDGGTLELMYEKTISDLSATGDTPPWDSRFHLVLVFAAAERFYFQQGRTGLASIYNTKKENMIRQMADFYARKSPQQEVRMKGIQEGLNSDFTK